MTRRTADYVFFFRKESPFSQFHDTEFKVDGKTFTAAEQYMMYSKAMLFKDEAVAEQILVAGSPPKMKALGRKVSGFDERTWREHREEIVYRGNMEKFSQNPDLHSLLMETGERQLVEASPFDRIWGIGMGANAKGVENPANWKGQNLLGKALMRVRETLRQEDAKKGE